VVSFLPVNSFILSLASSKVANYPRFISIALTIVGVIPFKIFLIKNYGKLVEIKKI